MIKSSIKTSLTLIYFSSRVFEMSIVAYLRLNGKGLKYHLNLTQKIFSYLILMI